MTTGPEPGDRRPTLDRPPGDRYVTAATAAGPEAVARRRRAELLRAIAIALGGALALTILGGVLAVTLGLVVVAGLIGWLLGSLVGPRAVAVALAVGSVVLGLAGIWVVGRLVGGVLGPIQYLAEVQGVLAVAHPVVAGLVAAASSRPSRSR